MKVQLKKSIFLQSLQKTQSIIEKRNTMPILSNILIEGRDSQMEITVTDLEVSFRDICDAAVIQGGGITINARKLYEIIKELPEDNVELSLGDSGRVSIKSGKSRFSINSLPVSEFPSFPQYNEGRLTIVDSELIGDIISKTSFAVSTDETRRNINGLYFENEDGKLIMVGTDGYRLALAEKATDMDIGLKKGVILPKKGVLELKKLLEQEGSLLAGFTESSAIFKKGGSVLVIRLIDGEFPKYRQVIPKGNDKTIKVNRERMAGALRRMSLLSSEKIKGVRFNITKEKVELSSSNPDLGEATEDMEIDYNGEPLEVAFNANYILDILGILTGENAVIEIKDNISSCIMRSEEMDGCTYVIMPMRI
ncbi:MAG: DNA polymerase III subunit beta [Deltaproteobacteria bacterium]|nr:DNA polymerase III subunit beta [Deltaproteobacteria bacterium]